MASRPERRPRRLTMPALLAAVFAHWRRERQTVRQGLIALAICVGVTVVAGVVLGAMETLLERLPGLLILVPAAIGMRGAVFGALGARLGTGMLTGQYDGKWGVDSFLGQNVVAAAVLTTVTSGLLALLARATAVAFGLPTISVWSLLIISLLGAVLSSIVVMGAVLLLARAAAARSWDMDAIGVPIISSTADISTLPAIVLVAAFAVGNPVVEAVLGGVLGLIVVAAMVYGLRTRLALARRIIAESLPVLCYAAVMGILAGTVLSARLESLIASPALLVAIPPFAATSGALGGILSARLASQLHLGLVVPHRLPDRPALLDGTLLLLLAVIAFAGVGVLAHIAAVLANLASPGIGGMIAIVLLGGLLAAALLFIVAYYSAATSYRFGLDPDNYGVPVVTATMDFLGILCLVASLAMLGFG
jgi:mgtE-like transporter